MTKLLINIDHVATLRNARRETFPDPVRAAAACEDAGADGIVFHLREDRRHIRDEDVRRLKESVRGKLDFECSTASEIIGICCRTGPDLATLVPERREEVTTEGGIDAVGRAAELTEVVRTLIGEGIPEVALFVDPDPDQVDAAAETGAHSIELHTGTWTNARSKQDRTEILDRMARTAEQARLNGLWVHAGHGLDYNNISAFLSAVGPLDELSIGFAIIARSLFTGLPSAVRDMKHLLP